MTNLLLISVNEFQNYLQVSFFANDSHVTLCTADITTVYYKQS